MKLNKQIEKDYWIGVVEAEIFANGHGDENSANAPLIALCESWATHIGMSYAHRTYGNDASWGELITWERWLEETWNETTNHIPIGLYHDLADTGEPTFLAGGIQVSACNWDNSGCTLIDDQVSGFTNQQMFSCLNTDITTPDAFIARLINNHLVATPNTAAQVNNLFNQY